MNTVEIGFARRELDRARQKTPYGDPLPTPWALLRDALDTIEEIRMLQDTEKPVKVTEEMIDEWINDVGFHRIPDTTLTVCALRLKNGFTVIGKSATISMETFNEDVGREIAFKDAKEQCWELIGFHLAAVRAENAAHD